MLLHAEEIAVKDSAKWRASFRLERFDQDVDKLDYVLEYTTEDLRRRAAQVIRGKAEAEAFYHRLLKTNPGIDDPVLWSKPGFRRPLLRCITPPASVQEHVGNLLMGGGVSCMWQTLIGNGTVTAGQALTYFSNAQAAVGVGDSSTAAAVTQTDLQAATNKLRVAMDATFPTHTDGTGAANQTITFKGTFTTGQANFSWQEVGIFNSTTAGTGRMLNRLVQNFGTKASGSWAMQMAITIS
jgi:hypothetical protein